MNEGIYLMGYVAFVMLVVFAIITPPALFKHEYYKFNFI